MPVLLSVHLPMWSADLARRRWRVDPSHTVLITRIDHQREVVASCCAVALRAGVAPGMTVAHARALLPIGRVHAAAEDAARDRRSLRALAEHLTRLVPIVALDPPDGLWLDATGCERLYGGVDRLIRRLVRTLAKFDLAASIAGAPTWGAAWALARFAPAASDATPLVLDAARLAETLAPLPAAALRLEESTLQQLHRIGIERIGDLLALPRPALADRYGDAPLLRLDQALGRAFETIVPVRPRPPVMAEQLFDGPTDRPETITLVVRELIDRIGAMLDGRQAGCRLLEITLLRSDLDPLVLIIRTARPTRDPVHLRNLARPKVESAHLGFGVEGVRIRAAELARLSHQQHSEWAGETGEVSDEHVGRLVDTLAARLGTQRILRVRPVESHIPERAFLYEPVHGIDDHHEHTGRLIDADRPSSLRPRPVPIDAVCLVPEGPIARLMIGGDAHRIVATVGPERIEPEWWRGHAAARDYFKVQTESGRWLWVFRDIARGRWFLHGEWV